jgi:hypothetical protein
MVCTSCSNWFLISIQTAPDLNSGKKRLAVLKTCMSLLKPPPSEDSLIEIYLSISNPAFPLVYLPPGERPIDSVLHSKLCLAALNHCRHYRSSITSIRSLVHTSVEEVGQDPSRLSSISAALLDLSGRPVLDAEANYLLLARVRLLFDLLPVLSLIASRLLLKHSSWVSISTHLVGLFPLGKKICVVPCGGRSAYMMHGLSVFCCCQPSNAFPSGCHF